jgi:Lipocalin-like domain
MNFQFLKGLTATLLLGGILFTSCSKEDNDTPAPPTKSELLSKTWILTDLTFEEAGIKQSAFEFFPDCYRDNLLTYAKAGTYQATEGATKCISDDPEVVEQGTWSLIENETKISQTSSSGSQTIYFIEELTSNSLKGSYTETRGNGEVTKYTLIFSVK